MGCPGPERCSAEVAKLKSALEVAAEDAKRAQVQAACNRAAVQLQRDRALRDAERLLGVAERALAFVDGGWRYADKTLREKLSRELHLALMAARGAR